MIFKAPTYIISFRTRSVLNNNTSCNKFPIVLRENFASGTRLNSFIKTKGSKFLSRMNGRTGRSKKENYLPSWSYMGFSVTVTHSNQDHLTQWNRFASIHLVRFRSPFFHPRFQSSFSYISSKVSYTRTIDVRVVEYVQNIQLRRCSKF